MQDFKRVLKFNCKWKEDWTIKTFRLAFNVNYPVLSNGCEHVWNVIYWIKIAFFFKNLQKSPSGWGLRPQTPIATGGWRLRPQTPVCDTFEYTSFLNTSPKLDISAF